MGNGITKIKTEHVELYTYVSVREWSEHWPASIMIQQGGNSIALVDDVVLLEGEDHAKKVVAAIKKHAALLGWEV